jgi:hypothetical protein
VVCGCEHGNVISNAAQRSEKALYRLRDSSFVGMTGEMLIKRFLFRRNDEQEVEVSDTTKLKKEQKLI